MLFFGFDTKNAIAVSNFTIFTCSVTRYLYTLDKKHPVKKHSVIIDYNIAIVMMPTVMIGSILGVFVNIVFPAVMLQLALVVLLVFTTSQSFRKARELYKKENEERKVRQ